MVPGAVTAAEAATCGATFESRFNAVDAYVPTRVSEVRGRLLALTPALCGQYPSGSGSWISIVTGSSFGSPWNIVQMGYWRCDGGGSLCDGQLHAIWAWGNAQTGVPPVPQDLGVVAPGSSHGFAVRLIPGRSVDFLMDGHTVASVPLSEVSWMAQGGTASQIAEEKWLAQDSFAGSAAHPEQFTSLRLVPTGGVLRPDFPPSWAGYRDAGLSILSTTSANFWNT